MANLTKAQREDREKKEAQNIIKRGDRSYVEIEEFREYELSWAIAFEMAKRDPLILRDLKRFIEFYKRHKDKIKYIPSHLSDFESAFEYRIHRKAKRIFSQGFDYFRDFHWLDAKDIFFINYESEILDMINRYLYNFSEISSKAPDELSGLIKREPLIFEHTFKFNNTHFFLDKLHITYEDIIKAIEKGEINSSEFEAIRRVSAKFSRPKLKIPALYNKSVEIELNLALPVEELIAYIKLIKSTYEKDKRVLLSTIELLEADDTSFSLESIDTESIYKKDRRKTLPQKYADLFFIYDCYSNNLSKEYALRHINYYWNEQRRAFPDKFQEKTYKKYLKLAKDFIQKRYYRSLIVGKK